MVLALALSLSPWALAAESRETDFFEDQPHTELSFDEIEYKHIEAEPILAAFEEIRSLMEDAANEETVSSKFDAVVNQIMEILTMSSIANILVTQDVTNETYKVEYAYVDMLWWDVFDVFALLCRDLLTSPCAAFLKAQLTDDDIAYYSAYEKATEEDKARNARETELVLAYYDAALQSYAVEYEGETYEEAAVEEAYAAGEMEYEFYDDLLKEFAKAKNAVMGEIFMEMLSLRQKTAKRPVTKTTATTPMKSTLTATTPSRNSSPSSRPSRTICCIRTPSSALFPAMRWMTPSLCRTIPAKRR